MGLKGLGLRGVALWAYLGLGVQGSEFGPRVFFLRA